MSTDGLKFQQSPIAAISSNAAMATHVEPKTIKHDGQGDNPVNQALFPNQEAINNPTSAVALRLKVKGDQSQTREFKNGENQFNGARDLANILSGQGTPAQQVASYIPPTRTDKTDKKDNKDNTLLPNGFTRGQETALLTLKPAIFAKNPNAALDEVDADEQHPLTSAKAGDAEDADGVQPYTPYVVSGKSSMTRPISARQGRNLDLTC